MKSRQSFNRIISILIFWFILIETTSYSQVYPFSNRNMFFGLTQLGNSAEGVLAGSLGVSWISMDPLVSWFSMEKSPGSYDFDELDTAVKRIQNNNLDCTPVLFAVNAFGDKRARLIEKFSGQDMTGFLRSDSSFAWRLFPNEQDSTMSIWLNFVSAVVERYDMDGVNDMPGLKYAIRNWHLLEEYPMIFIDADNYINLLKATSPIIKQKDPNAKIILAGLAGNYSRYFAFMDSLIADDDAGVINGVKHVRLWWKVNPAWQSNKRAFEKILSEGKNYYDIADLHLYEEKETFLEGKIAWMKNTITGNGSSKPIWCIEGGGPLKLTEAQHLAGDLQGDWYFGPYTEKENAEFVVKLSVMAAANGIERDHWGLSATPEGAYWSGPWHNMALATSSLQLKPSFYSFKLMIQMIKDFKNVVDRSTNDYRLYEFSFDNDKCYVAWSRSGNPMNINVQNLFNSESTVKVTYIITDLSSGTDPQEETVPPASIPISLTPIFISKVGYPTTVEMNNYPVPTKHFLYQNYPNPFNPETKIKYSLPFESRVSLKIYDVLGREVVELIRNENESAGNHEVEFNAQNLSSGIYFYKLSAGNYSEMKKMVVLK